jgi:hypothetical protein
MSDKARIRPLARRLDSLSGSPTSRSLGAVKPKTSPKQPGEVSLSSSSASRDEKEIKEDADLSVRDILAQAKMKEAKKDIEPPVVRGRKQVIRTDIETSNKMSFGIYHAGSGTVEIEQEGVAIDVNETRCIPVKVPFEKSTEMGDEEILSGVSLIQFPSLLPTMIPPQGAEGSPAHPAGKRRGRAAAQAAAPSLSATTGTPFSEIPDGRVGTLKVHKSGKTVLHIGTTQFDVTQGQNPSFRTEVACVCPAESEIILLGEINKRLVVSPRIS